MYIGRLDSPVLVFAQICLENSSHVPRDDEYRRESQGITERYASQRGFPSINRDKRIVSVARL